MKTNQTPAVSESRHTPEPWRVGGAFVTSEGPTICNCLVSSIIGDETATANAHRIVACVNACAGIENPAAIGAVVEAAKAVINEHDVRGRVVTMRHLRAALAALKGGGK